MPARPMQVWLALLAAVIGTTFAYHLLNYSSPFGEFDTLRLRRSTQAANQVKTFVVESRVPVLLHQPCCPSHIGAACLGCQNFALLHRISSAVTSALVRHYIPLSPCQLQFCIAVRSLSPPWKVLASAAAVAGSQQARWGQCSA